MAPTRTVLSAALALLFATMVAAPAQAAEPRGEVVGSAALPSGDDYPYRDQPDVVDRWAFYSGQDTSFVAWRMEQLTGYFHNSMSRNGIVGHWGNAPEWAANGRKLGYDVDRVPKAGAIAQWDPGKLAPPGHVAYIAAVAGDQVTVEEYNWSTPLRYSSRVVPSSQISWVIHFAPGT
ncbi:CHAP domain-containing protein [Amycolatopsis sp. NPDC059021]|uniref:CHAP domain-containing protein n=1 Tax=Amycolatopsis sp. NPDC059021 TaxID=3346704 RepID=UPI00366DCA3C